MCVFNVLQDTKFFADTMTIKAKINRLLYRKEYKWFKRVLKTPDKQGMIHLTWAELSYFYDKFGDFNP